MKQIPFFKYTSYGNNFVIIDETQTTLLTEAEKSKFAFQATNINYGVGSDNFLVIQPCRSHILQDINGARHYWDGIPDSNGIDFIFRMFEPDGVEALCCANGLMSIANYLYHQYGIETAHIMTEIPSASPKNLSLGLDSETGSSWVNLGHPRRVPPDMVMPSITSPYDDQIDIIGNVKINFRMHDLAPFSKNSEMEISGYLIFTGEPHFVIIPEMGFSIKELGSMMFLSTQGNLSQMGGREKRAAFGTWLIHHIGTYLNRKYDESFPVGINVNFVRIDPDTGELEYRCFKRGIYRETLACGTGALAVSYIVKKLNVVNRSRIILRPHRCRWYDPTAQIITEDEPRGWTVYGKPHVLIHGRFMAADATLDEETHPGTQKVMDPMPQEEQPFAWDPRLSHHQPKYHTH